MPTTSEKLIDIIREEVRSATFPDAEIVASRVIKRVTRDMVADMVGPYVLGLVKDFVRDERRRLTIQATRDAQSKDYAINKPISEENARGKIASRIDTERARRDDAFFNVWKETSTGPKFLGDCTVADLMYSRDQQLRRAAELAEAAERDDLLAQHLRRSRSTTLRDMGYDKAIKAFVKKPHLLAA